MRPDEDAGDGPPTEMPRGGPEQDGGRPPAGAEQRTGAPEHQAPPGAPAERGGRGWLAKGAIATAALGVATAVTTSVLTNRVDSIVNPPAPPPSSATPVTPTGTAVTLLDPEPTGSPTPRTPTSQPATQARATATPYGGPPGSGWSQEGSRSRSDFFSVLAKMDPADECNGATGWAFTQRPRELADLDSEHLDAWARDNGGVPQSGNIITITLTTRFHARVVIDHIGVRVVKRSAPTVRTRAQFGGCGGLVPAVFAADLDRRPAAVKAIPGDTGGRTTAPSPLPHLLSDRDPTEVWHLRLDTKACDCSVVPYFTWSSGDVAGTYEITDRGRPWRVTGVAKAQKAEPLEHGWQPY